MLRHGFSPLATIPSILMHWLLVFIMEKVGRRQLMLLSISREVLFIFNVYKPTIYCRSLPTSVLQRMPYLHQQNGSSTPVDMTTSTKNLHRLRYHVSQSLTNLWQDLGSFYFLFCFGLLWTAKSTCSTAMLASFPS